MTATDRRGETDELADLLRWLRLLNTEIDLHLDCRPGPIPLCWLEDSCAAAFRERDRRRVGELLDAITRLVLS